MNAGIRTGTNERHYFEVVLSSFNTSKTPETFVFVLHCKHHVLPDCYQKARQSYVKNGTLHS